MSDDGGQGQATRQAVSGRWRWRRWAVGLLGMVGVGAAAAAAVMAWAEPKPPDPPPPSQPPAGEEKGLPSGERIWSLAPAGNGTLWAATHDPS